MKIALLPGGFKPPHLGHYNMAKYLADFADKVIVRIGQKEREGIGKELALEIWNFYKEFDPDPRSEKLIISVAQSPSPVKDVYDFVEKIAPEGSTIILGLGEKDASDRRYNSIPKFAEPRNIKADIELVPPQAGGISGTRMREIIKANDKDTFFEYIPDYLPEEVKEEIWTKLADTTMPNDIEEMMGGTMNKEEMAKHLSNMVKLRKSFKKQGDQMVPVPTNLTKGLRRKLYEGRYDQEILMQSRFLLNMFKAEFGKEYTSPRGDTGDIFDEPFKGNVKTSDGELLWYDFDFTFTPSSIDDERLGPEPFVVTGAGDGDGMEISILYNPDAFPQAYNNLNAEIKDTIRHEFEHVIQDLLNKPERKDPEADQGEGFDYYTAPEEIPAFVQGLYKQAKTRRVPLSKMISKFLDTRELEFEEGELEQVKKIWTDWARKNLPAAQLDEKLTIGDKVVKTIHTNDSDNPEDHEIEYTDGTREPYLDHLKKENYPPYKANQVQQVRYKASDVFTKDIKKAKKLGYDEDMKEHKLFSKEWWSDFIMEEILKEGGAAGHMAHPFDLPNVNTGRDLIKSFEQAANSLKKEPGAVKIDGVNASIRLINTDGKREFAMDRGSKKALDLKGITKADLEDRFGAGHGMVKAGGDVLDIFNDALPSTEKELKALGLWENPNIMFNMEYVSGKSNVQDYGKNFLALHGLLEVETKEVQGARKMLTKRVTTEKSFNQADMDRYLKALEPFAKKKGFEIYGSVPTTFTKDPDFKKALGQQYKIEFAEGAKTKSLAQWLNDVTDIPADARIKMNLETGGTKDVGALSKQVYFAVFGGETIDDLFDNEQDIQKAIQGATTYLATEKLGDEILDVLDSPMGSVNDHEGVVIRDPKIHSKPFKITGKFITGGVSSDFQKK